MRSTFAENLSPQGLVIALDAMIDALTNAVSCALASEPSIGLDRWLVELESMFDHVERAVAAAGASGSHRARRRCAEARALLWALLPIELYARPNRKHRS